MFSDLEFWGNSGGGVLPHLREFGQGGEWDLNVISGTPVGGEEEGEWKGIPDAL